MGWKNNTDTYIISGKDNIVPREDDDSLISDANRIASARYQTSTLHLADDRKDFGTFHSFSYISGEPEKSPLSMTSVPVL